MNLQETMSFQQVHLCVSQGKLDIVLCKQRLYLHEYATSPPVDELCVLIKEDDILEAPLYGLDIGF